MPDFFYESVCYRDGYSVVAGIDEAGRGPLAGPVSAAAVVLPRDYSHDLLDDSKKLSERQRERLYEELTGDSRILWSLCLVDADEIDRRNILRATHLAMAGAFAGICPPPDIALIDGRPVREFPGEHRAIVKGDALSLSIAAASIVAKVERDRRMRHYAELYPEYGFERHKGYGTAEHLAALRRYGPCPIHRRTFAPVAALERASP